MTSVRLLRRGLLLLWLALKPLIVGAAVIDYVIADENDDVRRVWALMNDDTQPIPIIR